MIRIGTRGSALALAQSGQIAQRLRTITGSPVELITVLTAGDHSTQSLASLGGTGVFASALRESLLAGDCDLVVHSLKDLPTAVPPGLRIAAVPRRADARDAFCASDGLGLHDLQAGAVVGTGSPRRAAQLRAARPDLVIADIRGNVDTRLGRVAAGDLDAVLLAAAGLERLGRSAASTELLELSDWPTAPGQGALAIETRDDRSPSLDSAVATLEHSSTRLAVQAEREVLARLDAGCAAPIGATAQLDDGMLFLTATVYAPDGGSQLTSSHALVIDGTAAERARQPVELGQRVAEELLSLGAADLAPLGGQR